MPLEKIRCFIAFDIDDETILTRLGETQEQLVRTGADLKLVETQNIHVTLRFLGEIAPQLVNSIQEEMKMVKFSSFDIELRGLGVFPNLRHPNVVWVGIKKGAEELKGIFAQLEPRLRALGLRPDVRGFSPHITIARVKSGRNKTELIAQIAQMENLELGVMKADALRLKKSILTPRGPIYSTLYEVRPQI
ncbi:RNA 2',3'-cyclic phosphodiesterase [Candidatus Bathyarchaeota archaeon]|nr:RNA 2',3'-cyclic phosphodiesterase [Candidatus Bathyarchaeota archaeon]